MMNRFKFDMSDAQFKELMILLDPQHTNFISYQHFLNLFEQRETKVSVRIYNTVKIATIIFFDTTVINQPGYR